MPFYTTSLLFCMFVFANIVEVVSKNISPLALLVSAILILSLWETLKTSASFVVKEQHPLPVLSSPAVFVLKDS